MPLRGGGGLPARRAWHQCHPRRRPWCGTSFQPPASSMSKSRHAVAGGCHRGRGEFRRDIRMRRRGSSQKRQAERLLIAGWPVRTYSSSVPRVSAIRPPKPSRSRKPPIELLGGAGTIRSSPGRWLAGTRPWRPGGPGRRRGRRGRSGPPAGQVKAMSSWPRRWGRERRRVAATLGTRAWPGRAAGRDRLHRRRLAGVTCSSWCADRATRRRGPVFRRKGHRL